MDGPGCLVGFVGWVIFCFIYWLINFSDFGGFEPCPKCGKSFTKKKVGTKPVNWCTYLVYYECENCGADRGTTEEYWYSH